MSSLLGIAFLMLKVMATVEDSGVMGSEYDDTVAEISQDVMFLKREWDRVNNSVIQVTDHVAGIDQKLGTYEKHFASLDHRFDLLHQVLTKMEANQISDKAHGKAVASSADGSPPPMIQSSKFIEKEEAYVLGGLGRGSSERRNVSESRGD
ncbi:hypothetical protein HID58_004769 [Brassica napus]|uniref:Uncharacterized protein n=1 Tax=Brassica napus TaxID=3708 RepID=A0ABQ8E795_BRANA|nr:hypothetical protein HID58_004769 [Brassica napus]